ncbi:MAG: hypothetical protein ABI678_23545 [Kofleriaceae bacterium]
MSAEPPKPLDPEVTPDASSRITIDPAVRPERAKSRSWSALLRESWHRAPTAPADAAVPESPDPKSR